MTIAERLEEFRVALELFPRCARCGRDLSQEPITSLRIHAERPNRLCCPSCPAESTNGR